MTARDLQTAHLTQSNAFFVFGLDSTDAIVASLKVTLRYEFSLSVETRLAFKTEVERFSEVNHIVYITIFNF